MDFDLPELGRRRSRRGSRTSWRGRHRHLFAWFVLGGVGVALLLLLFGVLQALGLGGLIASAYFGIAEAVLPTAWHDELHALPGIVHVLLVVGLVWIVAGLAGELFD